MSARVYAPPRVGTFVDRAWRIADTLLADLRSDLTAMDHIVCEFPNFQESAKRSMGWRTGDLQKLTFLVGVLAQACRPAQFTPVTPVQWKGQLPKHLTVKRVTTALGPDVCAAIGLKSHAWDAAGIGLWALRDE